MDIVAQLALLIEHGPVRAERFGFQPRGVNR
jgi:hypothetical protein